jgi:hypothetical protein
VEVTLQAYLTWSLYVSGQRQAPAQVPGSEPRYPLSMRLGGPQSRSEPCEEIKNIFPLSGIEARFLGCPVTIPTEQFQLQRPNSQVDKWLNCKKISVNNLYFENNHVY